MPAPDTRAPFAALGGTVPPELAALPTPCYLLDEGALARNGQILGALAQRTGCRVLLAQKAFSNYDLYPVLAPYLAGTEASGLYEARLGAEEMPGGEVSFVFAPLGFGDWRATVATVTGLIAKENVVATFAVLFGFAGEVSENGNEIWTQIAGHFTALTAYSFMIFNLLCAPCFAAMGAIRREMNNGKWTAAAIGYMCLLAYCTSLVVYQIGGLFTGEVTFNFFTIVAVAILAAAVWLLVRRPRK